ncbi:hypothetical protein CXK86_01580 [Paenibacillus sp. BGI2013]|nr:hypothetical protein BK124_08775 [Paenibacillus amylolyticus]PKQ92836.1 hypothetical protein CXK86_01580 [Paenibacillus sp. BGI2013]
MVYPKGNAKFPQSVQVNGKQKNQKNTLSQRRRVSLVRKADVNAKKRKVTGFLSFAAHGVIRE